MTEKDFTSYGFVVQRDLEGIPLKRNANKLFLDSLKEALTSAKIYTKDVQLIEKDGKIHGFYVHSPEANLAFTIRFAVDIET